MALAAIIFDLDGTIIDTEMPDYTAWQALYAAHGLELPMSLWKQRVGMVVYDGATGIFDPETYFAQVTGKPLSPEARRAQYAQYMALCEAQSVLPGVLALIAAAEARHIPLGLASNSDREWVERWLKFLGLRERFACVYTRDDVTNAKPAPDMYLATAACLNVDPAHCLAIEDSPTGMQAALSAGMRVIAVPNGLTAHHTRPAVHLTLNALSDLPAEDLLARFV